MGNNEELTKSMKESLQKDIPKISYASVYFWAVVRTIIMLVVIAVVGFFGLMMMDGGVIADETDAIVAITLFIGVMILTLIITPIRYIRGQTREFQERYQAFKNKTTCPECKTPFVWLKTYTTGEVLSKDYKTRAVQEGSGENAYYRRGVFVYGQMEKFHNGFCLECGHTTETKSIVEYEKEV